MGMIVQHNITAMNANRNLNVTTSAQAKSTEKLSTGYKINRAADDASGLSISEKMRRQIRGLTQASANAQDGISSVQTAEGALTEVHDMLQRMDELATKASNGTLSTDDRQNVQDELDQLITEIDRISETTKFNEIYLLKGNSEEGTEVKTLTAKDAGFDGKLSSVKDGISTFELTKPLSDGDTIKIAGRDYAIGKLAVSDNLNNSVEGYGSVATVSNKTMSVGDSITHNGKTYTLTDKIGVEDITLSLDGTSITIGSVHYTVSTNTSASDNQLSAQDAKTKIIEALDAGEQIYVTGFKTKDETGAAVSYANKTQVVAALGDGEVHLAGLSDSTTVVVARAGDPSHKAVSDANALTTGDKLTKANGAITVVTNNTPISAQSAYDAVNGLATGNTVTIGKGESAKTYTVSTETDLDSWKATKEDIAAMIYDMDDVDINGTAYTVVGDIGSGSKKTRETISAEQAYKMIANELEVANNIGADSDKLSSVTNNGDGSFKIEQSAVEVTKKLSFNLHVGSDADTTNKITVNIEKMDAKGLGIQNLNVTDGNGTAATYAIDSIEAAIKTVSTQRSALGAVQNRLEHTIKNVDNVIENTSSAESEIRDTNMATEMVQYSKNNILSQAGQSMLAQANQSNQGVLSLLG